MRVKGCRDISSALSYLCLFIQLWQKLVPFEFALALKTRLDDVLNRLDVLHYSFYTNTSFFKLSSKFCAVEPKRGNIFDTFLVLWFYSSHPKLFFNMSFKNFPENLQKVTHDWGEIRPSALQKKIHLKQGVLLIFLFSDIHYSFWEIILAERFYLWTNPVFTP